MAITPAQANYDGSHVYAGGGVKCAYRKATLPVAYAFWNVWLSSTRRG